MQLSQFLVYKMLPATTLLATATLSRSYCLPCIS